MTRVYVDADFERALRLFVRRVEQSGLLIELRKHESFIPWTERRRMAQRRGRQRWLERARKMERR